jgi:hypothetical protein
MILFEVSMLSTSGFRWRHCSASRSICLIISLKLGRVNYQLEKEGEDELKNYQHGDIHVKASSVAQQV